MEDKEKSRQQTIVEYYEALQVEYLVAELRHRIYPETKDKKYYERVMFGKYQTIQRICESKNNQLPSIFTDQDYKVDLERRVYRDNAHPIFTYRNKEQRAQQEPLDLMYYYAIDSDVRCTINNESYIGKIVTYISGADTITVSINGKTQTLLVGQVSRIL